MPKPHYRRVFGVNLFTDDFGKYNLPGTSAIIVCKLLCFQGTSAHGLCGSVLTWLHTDLKRGHLVLFTYSVLGSRPTSLR